MDSENVLAHSARFRSSLIQNEREYMFQLVWSQGLIDNTHDVLAQDCYELIFRVDFNS